MSLYERVGGDAYFVGLVESFYDGVESDPILRPIYPENLAPGKTNLTEFLIQYWGGPQNYSARQGHPRLRMRHSPFAIGPAQQEAWLRHMSEAVRESSASPGDASELLAYFDSASKMLINRAEGSPV